MSKRAYEFADRYVRRDEARRRFGGVADAYARYQLRGDPLADDVVAAIARDPRVGEQVDRALADGMARVPDAAPEVRELFAALDATPPWVDPVTANLGALTYQRIGSAGMFILSAWSLMNGYHSAPAVKPLAFTKQLDARAPRRLAETGRFVTEVSQVDGMARFAPGFAIAVRVRLMHAWVRRMLASSGRWDEKAWGVPINQADMLGTIMEFSLLVLSGARRMGFLFSRRESEAVMHLWRWVGHVSGVDPWLLEHLTTEAHGVRLAEMVHVVQPGPDADSRALAAALRRVPEQLARSPHEQRLAKWVVKYHDGLTRAFNGDAVADDLGIPNKAWKYAIYPTRAIVTPIERVRRIVPGATRLASLVGNWRVRAGVEKMLAGQEPSYRVSRA